MTRDAWIAGARRKLANAQSLLDAGGFADAYYLAGYAVEFGLKAVIAKRFVADAIPDKRLVLEAHTHNLSALLKLSGLVLKSEGLLNNWAVVVGWSEASRYDAVSLEQARELIDAISHSSEGVLPWLTQRW